MSTVVLILGVAGLEKNVLENTILQNNNCFKCNFSVLDECVAKLFPFFQFFPL